MTTTTTKPAAPAQLDLRTDGFGVGPKRLVLFGPPGTGKTHKALEGWIVPALRAGVAPGEILATSFTNAAADELGSRVAGSVPDLDIHPDELGWCSSTIHSQALATIPDHLRRPLYKRDKKRLAEDDTDGDEGGKLGGGDRRLRDAALTAWDYIRATLAHGATTVDRVEAVLPAFAGDNRFAEYDAADLAREIDAYEAAKAAAGESDFSDWLELAANHGQVPYRRLLIVDEAQDLSLLQWVVVQRWIDAAEHVVLIADPDQAIHEWAGADPGPILTYARSEGWAVRRLAKSRRVPARAHRLARRLILADPHRMDAPYEPADLEGSVAEADTRQVVDALEEAARARTKTLVLSRSKRLLGERLGNELVRRGVPHVSERGYSPLGAPTILAAARATIDLRRGAAVAGDVAELLDQLPARGHFPAKQKEKIVDQVRTWPKNALVRPRSLEVLGVSLKAYLELSLCDAMHQLLRDEGGYRGSRDRGAELERLVQAHGEDVLRETPTVVLTTLHASKGREAPLVVVDLAMPKAVAHGLADGRSTPSERRLLYVGITRTQDRLLLMRDGSWDLGRALCLGR